MSSVDHLGSNDEITQETFQTKVHSWTRELRCKDCGGPARRHVQLESLESDLLIIALFRGYSNSYFDGYDPITALPDVVPFSPTKSLHLWGVVIGNMTHFRAIARLNDTYVCYDGMENPQCTVLPLGASRSEARSFQGDYKKTLVLYEVVESADLSAEEPPGSGAPGGGQPSRAASGRDDNEWPEPDEVVDEPAAVEEPNTRGQEATRAPAGV